MIQSEQEKRKKGVWIGFDRVREGPYLAFFIIFIQPPDSYTASPLLPRVFSKSSHETISRRALLPFVN